MSSRHSPGSRRPGPVPLFWQGCKAGRVRADLCHFLTDRGGGERACKTVLFSTSQGRDGGDHGRVPCRRDRDHEREPQGSRRRRADGVGTLYPTFAGTAKDEGFAPIANLFRRWRWSKKYHEQRRPAPDQPRKRERSSNVTRQSNGTAGSAGTCTRGSLPLQNARHVVTPKRISRSTQRISKE